MVAYLKPLPSVHSEATRVYWEGCREGKLLLQKCSQCGAYRRFIGHVCDQCFSEKLDWVQASGHATVYSFTVVYRPPGKEFAADVPYIVAIVELDEGTRMMTNIIGCAPDDVKVGMKVEVLFDNVTPEVSLPKFRPIKC